MRERIVLPFTLALVAFCFLSVCSAQTPASLQQTQLPPKVDSAKPTALSPQLLASLHRDLDGILDEPSFAAAQWGVVVQSLETGEYLYRRNENKLFLPASTLKLLTSAAALEYLGPDFRFSTSLLLNGTIQRGIVRGDLVIRGAGDPTLSKRFHPGNPLALFERWADTLEQLGVKRIAGNIVGDDSYFDAEPYAPGWAWDDLSYYYGAPASGLSLTENCVEINVSPGTAAGDDAVITISPNTAYVEIVNEVRTTRGDSLFSIDVRRDAGTSTVHVIGNIPLSYGAYTLQATVDNPASYAATVLREVLALRGIEVLGAALTPEELTDRVPYAEMRTLDVALSPPLSEILTELNLKSVNFLAEQILKTIAKERTGTGSTAKGVDLVKKFASQIGISPDNLSIVDGSGLSRLDLLTPQQMSAILRHIRRPDRWKVMMNALPLAGRTGTLANRLRGTKAEGVVRAKTGYLNFARSLAGFGQTGDGEPILFVLFTNNYPVPTSMVENAEDLVLMYLANFRRR
jgi:D-alanyl-D-alanine carboxypeptidase/D-alanyl-D-alanine-endopeptidase (penicillin-binding protein 4)